MGELVKGIKGVLVVFLQVLSKFKKIRNEGR